MSKNIFITIFILFTTYTFLTAQTEQNKNISQANVNLLLKIDTAIRDQNLKIAFYYIAQIKKNLHKYPSSSMSALMYWKEGRGYNALQQYEKAHDSYLKAINCLEKEPNIAISANVYYDLGLLESYRNKIDTQFPYFQKSIQRHEQSGNFEYLARGYDSYGYAFSGLGQQDSAIYYGKKALSIRHKDVSKVTICNTKANIGGYFLKKNQLDSAEYWLMSARAILANTDMTWDEYIPYDIKKSLAEVYLKTGRRQKALVYLKEVLIYAQNNNDPILLEPTFEILINDATQNKELAKIISLQKDFITFQQKQQQQTSAQSYSHNQTLLEIGLRENDYLSLQRSFEEQSIASRFNLAISLLFATMLATLAFLFYQKQRFSKNLQEEVEKKTASLRQSNAELERFAYIASHDLRTPLRNVISFINLTERRLGTLLIGETKEYMQYARTYALHMNQMIDDILNYSRLQNGTPINDKVTDVNLIYENTLHSLESKISEKQANIRLENKLPSLKIDETGMTQVLQNLLENALHYNISEQPSVVIGSNTNLTETCLYVSDNGIGIEPQYHDKVFDMFSRLHSLEKYAGTGLGLAITKKIVEQHGGRIWLDSALGKGTTVFVSFPN
jgi:signal transduction histidine kinase